MIITSKVVKRRIRNCLDHKYKSYKMLHLIKRSISKNGLFSWIKGWEIFTSRRIWKSFLVTMTLMMKNATGNSLKRDKNWRTRRKDKTEKYILWIEGWIMKSKMRMTACVTAWSKESLCSTLMNRYMWQKVKLKRLKKKCCQCILM